jgi:hypothetical protein
VHRRTFVAMTIGAVVGAVAGLGVLALAASRVLDGGLGATITEGSVRPDFVVSQGGLFILTIVAGTIGGAALGALGFAVARESAPDAPRIALGPLALVGAGVGLVAGFAAMRAGVGLAADITQGTVTLSVSRAAVVAICTGAVAGFVVGGGIERLSRPEIYGFGGEAWPANPVAFARDAVAAVGLPALAIVVAAALVWGLSTVLLEASHEVAMIVFGGAAALVLAAAAFIAAHPPKRPE